MTQNKLRVKVKEGKTELTVDHEGKDLTFLHPSYGPDTYFDIRDQIQNAGLSLPTMAENASYARTAFNSEDAYKKIGRILARSLWAFDKNLYVPNKGVYIYPEEISAGKDLEESELKKDLKLMRKA